jgi:NitT/TauT family transport system permease protein
VPDRTTAHHPPTGPPGAAGAAPERTPPGRPPVDRQPAGVAPERPAPDLAGGGGAGRQRAGVPAGPAAAEPGAGGPVLTATPAAAPDATAALAGQVRRPRRRPVRPPVRRRGPAAWLAYGLPPALLFAAIIGLWYLVSYRLLDSDRRFLLPPPHRVGEIAFLDRANAEVLLRALALTAGVAMAGLGVAILIGVSVGVLMSQARWIERAVYPWAVVLQTIPILALVPLIGFWFEFGLFSRVLVCVLIAVFPIISTTLFGLRSVDRSLHDLFTLHGAGRLTRLAKLQWPSALPAIFTGLRISAGLSVIGAIVGDFFFKQGELGIGALMEVYRQNLRSEQLFGAVVLSSLLGLVVFWFFGFLARRVVGSWHETHSDMVAE